MTDMERAVVITFNWETEETLHTMFDGDDAGSRAERFMNAEKDIGDFPPPNWQWFLCKNEKAAKVHAKHIVRELFWPETEGMRH